MKTMRALAMGALLVCAITACGGGSGGSTPAPNPAPPVTPPPPTPPPTPPQPAPMSTSNGHAYVAGAVGFAIVSDELSLALSTLVEHSQMPAPGSIDRAPRAPYSSPAVHHRLLRTGVRALLPAGSHVMQSRLVTFDCDSGSITNVDDRDPASGLGQVDTTYTQCVLDGVRIDGTARYIVQSSVFKTLTLNDLSFFFAPSEGLRLNGDIRMDFDPFGDGMDRYQIELDLELDEIGGDHRFVVDAMRTLYAQVLPGRYGPVDRSGNIKLEGSATAAVSLDAEGFIHLMTDGARLKFRNEADDWVLIYLDTNGDMQPEYVSRIPEDLLLDRPKTTGAPVVHAVDPMVGDRVVVNAFAFTAEDPNYDFVRFELQVIEHPDGAEIDIQQELPGIFRFSSTRSGIHDIRVLATDQTGLVGTLAKPLRIRFEPPEFDLGWPATITASQFEAYALVTNPVNVGPVTFRVLSGPLGMQFDTDGRLHWDASTWAFFPEQDFHVMVEAVNADHTVTELRTLRVANDEALAPIAVADALGVFHRHRIHWYDFGPTGGQQLVLATRGGSVLQTQRWTGQHFEQSWVYPFSEHHAAIGGIYTFSGGGPMHEIYVNTGRAIVVINRDTSRAVRSVETEFMYGHHIWVGHVDMTGNPSVIALHSDDEGIHYLVHYDAHTLTERWRYSFTQETAPAMWVGRLHDTPGVDAALSNGHVIDLRTQTLLWDAGYPFGAAIEGADPDIRNVGRLMADTPNGYGLIDVENRTVVAQFDTRPCNAVHTGLTDSVRYILSDCANGQIIGYESVADAPARSWTIDEPDGVGGLTPLHGSGVLLVAYAKSRTDRSASELVAIIPETGESLGTVAASSRLPGPFEAAGVYTHGGIPRALLFNATEQVSGGSKIIEIETAWGERSSSTLTGDHLHAHGAFFDADGDGLPMLYIADRDAGASLHALNGLPLWQTAAVSTGPLRRTRWFDIDGDGHPETLILQNQHFSAYDGATGNLIIDQTVAAFGAGITTDFVALSTPEGARVAIHHPQTRIEIYALSPAGLTPVETRLLSPSIGFLNEVPVAALPLATNAVDHLVTWGRSHAMSPPTTEFRFHPLQTTDVEKVQLTGRYVDAYALDGRGLVLLWEEQHLIRGEGFESRLVLASLPNETIVWQSPWFPGSPRVQSMSITQRDDGRFLIVFGTDRTGIVLR